jgi:hypothetical protein
MNAAAKKKKKKKKKKYLESEEEKKTVKSSHPVFSQSSHTFHAHPTCALFSLPLIALARKRLCVARCNGAILLQTALLTAEEQELEVDVRDAWLGVVVPRRCVDA